MTPYLDTFHAVIANMLTWSFLWNIHIMSKLAHYHAACLSINDQITDPRNLFEIWICLTSFLWENFRTFFKKKKAKSSPTLLNLLKSWDVCDMYLIDVIFWGVRKSEKKTHLLLLYQWNPAFLSNYPSVC